MVWLEFAKKLTQKFVSIDIIYKPVRKLTKIINCYFSSKLSLAFRSNFNENSKIRNGTACQCYYCSNWYSRKDKFDRYLSCCVGKTGCGPNFNTQTLVTFQENSKFQGDISLTVYVGFEITATTNECLDPKSKKLFVFSYIIIFAFHPELDIDRVILECSFDHSEHSLTSLNFLTIDQFLV